ncbi:MULTISPECIES: DevR family CRISPR-associated autoregulator [Sorangium]|uniref:CRISPR-associated protein n=1 Tax=Sorangium cellulosum TaxID=56 RepID=A0A4V0NHZ9_SORCE|nr:MULTISPECIES: DevR family CRISPR-associated autoregulator [Sorangium]AUX38432.1 CRISPR-associated protein [Sorangium cellulosum]WCQ97720.1 CRISPR-associated protein Cas7/Cst2/DevR [Sorangium sp. Soce836]
MATNYLYGTVLTGEAVAANNRGENIGNTTTLQKVFHQDDLHTSVSAEAIRFAIRYRFQLQGLQVNRTYSSGKLVYIDEKRATWDPGGDVYVDDDLMGFMDAAAAAKEREEEDGDESEEDADVSGAKGNGSKKGKLAAKPKVKGKTTKRPSPLAIGRAVSLRPYRGELSYNAVSGEKEKGKLSLYSAEMHTTEYQYSFGLNLGDVVDKRNIGHLVEAILDPPPVAGNHARFAYDFSPASIVLRLTNAHSSRIQNCFDHDEARRTYKVDRLLQRVESGDVPAGELIVAGEVAATPEGARLRELGATVLPGIAAAGAEARARVVKLGGPFAAVASRGAKG